MKPNQTKTKNRKEEDFEVIFSRKLSWKSLLCNISQFALLWIFDKPPELFPQTSGKYTIKQHLFQTGRGKVSLEEFQEFANRKPPSQA